MSGSDDEFVFVDGDGDIQLGTSPPDWCPDSPGGPALSHAALSASQHSRMEDEYEHIAYPSDDEGGYVHEAQEGEQEEDEHRHAPADPLATEISKLEASLQAAQVEASTSTPAVAAPSPPPAVDPVRDAAVEKELRRVQEENEALRKKLESPPTEGPFHVTSSTRLYACRECRAHIGIEEDVVSKEFCGATGRAYFVNQVYNAKLGPVHECVFKTGKHLIADLMCRTCDTMGQRVNIGWKYLKSGERSQKYKEGKFVLEEALLMKTGSWQ